MSDKKKNNLLGLYVLRRNDDESSLYSAKVGDLEWDDEELTLPNRVYKFCVDCLHMDRFPEEYVYLMCLDTKLNPIATFEVSHGSINTAILIPREIFKRALSVNTASIIIVHNHPTGSAKPSKEDDKATIRIFNAGEILGVPLIDHIIIGEYSYYSYKEAMKI